jgi:hypothetical protein
VSSRILIAFLCCVVSVSLLRAVSSGSIADDSHGGPNAHFRIANPAELGSARAEEIYQSIRESMAKHYAESSDPLAETYQHWVRANRFPYPSAAHGGVFINDYTNATAAPQFAARDRSHPYPAGSVIVKDGFIVTKEGNILTAPMNIIEKVPASAVSTDDWRFIQIRPNGTIIGAAAGDERTRFCAECHIQRNGALAPFFFVPSGNDGKPLARLRESDGLGVRAPGG